MANDQRPPYDAHEYEVMTNSIFHDLCELDETDREENNRPVPRNITILANRLHGFDNLEDVAYIAETILDDGLGFIERDIRTQNVWLTPPGREHCGEWIIIH